MPLPTTCLYQRLFAEKAKELHEIPGQLLAKNGESSMAGRGKSNSKSVTGTNENSDLKGVPSRNRDYWQFSVSRLVNSTTDDSVRRHLHKAGIEVKEVWLLNSQVKGAKTAKIRVAREHREKAKNPAIWPLHCIVRDWNFDKNRKQQQK